MVTKEKRYILCKLLRVAGLSLLSSGPPGVVGLPGPSGPLPAVIPDCANRPARREIRQLKKMNSNEESTGGGGGGGGGGGKWQL